MGAVKSTLEQYVELVCPDNETGQLMLTEDIVGGRINVSLGDLILVLDGPSGEFCNICGRTVHWGISRVAERMPDLNSIEERRRIGRRFPAGDYVCATCTANM